MNLDDVLERGLAAAAEDYDLPADGIERVREELAPATAESTERPGRRHGPRHWRPTGHAWLGIAAALVIVLIAVPIAIGGSGGSTGNEGGAGSSAALSKAPAGEANGTSRSSPSQLDAGAKHASAGQPGAPATAPLAVPSPAPLRKGEDFSSLSSAGSVAASGTAGTVEAPQRGLDPIPVTTSRVEKTGELDLQVSKGQVSATLSRLGDIARTVRGYVSASSTQESGSAPSGEVTLRVPVNRFEQAVHDARTITGTKVLSLETSGVDVTSKYVDLQARITSLKATRSTFLTILAKATTIGEILSVQQRVDDVQTQIEQLQGQLRVLASTTSMSTLTVTVDQRTAALAPRKAHHDNGFVKAVKLSVSRFVRGIEAIVGIIGPIVLVLLIVVLGWLGARFGYRATRRHLV